MGEAIREDGRRLIIVIVQDGYEPEIEFEGDFAPWQAIAALNEASWLLSQQEEEDAEKEG